MKPLVDYPDDELWAKVSAPGDHWMIDIVNELIRRAVRHAEIDADMGNGILAEIRETLAAVGCSHGPDSHASTPPMMYPEWVRCCLKHAIDGETERCVVVIGSLVGTWAGNAADPNDLAAIVLGIAAGSIRRKG